MRLWVGARRPWVMIAALFVLLALDHLIGEVELLIPAVFGSASVTYFSTYLPLIWSMAIADSFSARGLSVESRPMLYARSGFVRQGPLDVGLFLGGTVVAAVVMSLFGAYEGPRAAPVLILAGVACVLTLRFGASMGVFGATLVVVMTTTYPPVYTGSKFVRVLQPEAEPTWALACGIGVCVLAAALLVTNSARTVFRPNEAKNM